MTTLVTTVIEVELEKVEELDTKWMSDPKQLCNTNFHHYKKRIGGGVEIGPFGLLTLATQNVQEYTAVSFRILKNHAHKLLFLMCSDQSRSSLHSNPDDDQENKYYGTFVNVDPLHQELSLRTFIDHSVVESFGAQGRSCITARVYPRLAVHNNAHLYIFNNGTQTVIITSFRAWSMKKPRVNYYVTYLYGRIY